MWALSSNMILHRSCVAGVQYTSPQKPLRTSCGSHAEWSVWACVGNTASMLPRSTGNGSRFCWGISLIPLEHAAIDEDTLTLRLEKKP